MELSDQMQFKHYIFLTRVQFELFGFLDRQSPNKCILVKLLTHLIPGGFRQMRKQIGTNN